MPLIFTFLQIKGEKELRVQLCAEQTLQNIYLCGLRPMFTFYNLSFATSQTIQPLQQVLRFISKLCIFTHIQKKNLINVLGCLPRGPNDLKDNENVYRSD